LGGSEEILGKLTREIRDIAENLTLSHDEQAERLQQLADNEIRTIQEQNRLEEEQAKLFGLSLPIRDEEMVKQASSYWLAPPMLANLIDCYLEMLGANSAQRVSGRKALTTLKLDQSLRNKLLVDFLALGSKGSVAQAWERWLKGSESSLSITFDPSAAGEHRDVVFITPTHPLAKQASKALEPNAPMNCDFNVKNNELPAGRYPYAIYKWKKHGLNEDFTFQPVCISPEISEHLLELLEAANDHISDSPISPDEKQAIEHFHYSQWINARANHIENVSNVISSRIASLQTTHNARLAILEEQLNASTDSRIRRMKESQIESAKLDYQRRMDELKKANEQGDIIAEIVACGVLVTESSV
jgi:hypothetical protein